MGDRLWLTFYFLIITDAEAGFRKLMTNGSPRYNIRHIEEGHEPVELLVTYWEPQRIGVFLDLTCDRGYDILNWVRTDL